MLHKGRCKWPKGLQIMVQHLDPIRNSDSSCFYHIRLKGHLGPQWMDWFEGLHIELEANGNTLLSGKIPDQSALHGIFKKVRDVGMPLLSVNASTPKQADDLINPAK